MRSNIILCDSAPAISKQNKLMRLQFPQINTTLVLTLSPKHRCEDIKKSQWIYMEKPLFDVTSFMNLASVRTTEIDN
jgi:hypothetical protein